jgi:cation diffusion facilitator CzcD-associated flavoprotein CzcO
LTDGFANVLSDADSPVLKAIHDMCVVHLETKVRDPELREKLRPSYRAACKRLIMSDGFYEAIQRPNATLVTERIERIEPAGVRTRDGVLHALDVLVLATGFRVDRFVRPMQVTGAGGVTLDDRWASGPCAYMALAVPDFPNFFMLNGPNGPVGNFSLIEVAELQIGYVLQIADAVRAGRFQAASPSHDAMARFDAERRRAATTTIWNTGCKSWYLDASGLPTAWPFTWDRFREEMARPRFDDYVIHA